MLALCYLATDSAPVMIMAREMFTPEQRELARRRAAAIVKKEAANLGYDAASTRLMTNGASLSVNLAFKAIEGDAAAAGVATAPKTTTKSGGGSKPSNRLEAAKAEA
jgi:hypothetical protein